MNNQAHETISGEECTSRIFQLSGVKFEPDIAGDLWLRIVKHKLCLSEKIGRDAGFRIAGIDLLEDILKSLDDCLAYEQTDILKEMGAQALGRKMWDTISDSQLPKQVVQRRAFFDLGS